MTLPDFSRLFQRRRLWWSTLLGWALVECILSALPGRDMPRIEIVNFDKVEHVTFFTVGAFLLTGALTVTFPRWPWWRRLALAVACISAFGRLDEWHQAFTPGRSGNDFYDWLSDTIGGMIGAGVARWFFLYARRSGSHSGQARIPAGANPPA